MCSGTAAPEKEVLMTHTKAFAVLAAIGALFVVLVLPGLAFGHHLANDVPDNSDPNATSRNGQICSASAITPNGGVGDYSKNLNGWNYWLRYSTNCRSVWGRSSNQAPRRTDLATNRIPDSNWSGFCTGNTHYSGDTWYWTGEVDDAGHFSKVRVDDSGHDCSGNNSWLSLQF
jgi:hypothetical protein